MYTSPPPSVRSKISKNITGKAILVALMFIFSSPAITAQETEVLQELLQTIERTAEYDAYQVERIEKIKGEIKNSENSDLLKHYLLNQELFNEYRIFKQDSAFKYGIEARNLAVQLDSVPLMAEAVVNLGNVCVSAGMFNEALEFLEAIDPDEIPENIRSSYFGLLGRCYNDMADFSNLSNFTSTYNVRAGNYHQLALSLAETGTFNHSMLQAYIKYKEGKLNNALEDFLLLADQDLDLREKAVVNSILGDIYAQNRQNEKAVYHLSQASIADIQSSAKENLAMIRLSELLFAEGDLQNASTFIKKANEDAGFYGAQQRKIRVGAILPLIEEQIIQKIEQQRASLYRQNVIVSILLLFVMALALIIYSQVRKSRRAKRTIEEAHTKLQDTNGKLNDTNNQLKQVNHKLLEVNKIKEEYIGFFFTQDAEIFEKFREFKFRIEKDLGENDLEKLKYTVNNYDLKREKEKLLKNFDEAFIKLFPNFIEEFNSLLEPAKQIKIKKNQILNKELRIFALMRLGITHNEIIAQILGYSVTSIYTYKSKTRSKSTFSTREFEEKLLNSTTLQL